VNRLPKQKLTSRFVGSPPSLDAIQRKLRRIDEKLNDILLFARQQNDARLPTTGRDAGAGNHIVPREMGVESAAQGGNGQESQNPMYPGWGTLPPEVTNNPFFDPFAPPLVPFHRRIDPPQQASGVPDQSEGELTEVKTTRVVGKGKRMRSEKKHRI